LPRQSGTRAAAADGLTTAEREELRRLRRDDRRLREEREILAKATAWFARETVPKVQDSRFEVKMNWWKADGKSGVGRVVEEGIDDSGLFRLFGPENWEVLIKVLDGCTTNGRM